MKKYVCLTLLLFFTITGFSQNLYRSGNLDIEGEILTVKNISSDVFSISLSEDDIYLPLYQSEVEKAKQNNVNITDIGSKAYIYSNKVVAEVFTEVFTNAQLELLSTAKLPISVIFDSEGKIRQMTFTLRGVYQTVSPSLYLSLMKKFKSKVHFRVPDKSYQYFQINFLADVKAVIHGTNVLPESLYRQRRRN